MINGYPYNYLILTNLMKVYPISSLDHLLQASNFPSYECTDNMRKEKYVCTIFSVLITFYVNSRLNGFHGLIFFTIIVFLNTRENIFKRKAVSKIAP